MNPKKQPFQISSLMTVVIVLILTIIIESSISFTLISGVFKFQDLELLQLTWLLLRVGSVFAVILIWKLNRPTLLFQAIIFANSLLTLGLATTTFRLIGLLFQNNNFEAVSLLEDVALMAVVNILTFSIWYWLIDPPGIDESQPSDAPWDFLFPQRGDTIPRYENWIPRYTDYLYLAFTTSVAFSPTDVLPLTRRAKALMSFQAGVSLISITVIAGSAINIIG